MIDSIKLAKGQIKDWKGNLDNLEPGAAVYIDAVSKVTVNNETTVIVDFHDEGDEQYSVTAPAQLFNALNQSVNTGRPVRIARP